MLSISKALGAALWVLLIVVKWFQSTFCFPLADWWMETVLGTWEESIKTVIREAFANVTRFLNAFFAGLVSVFVDKSYYQSLRSSFQRPHAWQAWWTDDRPSTFNALIARDRSVHRGDAQQTRRTLSGQPKGTAPGRSQRARRAWAPWQLLPRSGAGVSGGASWLGARLGLGKRNCSASSAAAGLRVKGPAGMRRSGSDLFDRPNGFPGAGARKRGFLEDLRLGCEVGVSAAFDALRWTIRLLVGMPDKGAGRPVGVKRVAPPRAGADFESDTDSAAAWSHAGARSQRPRGRLPRTNSYSRWEGLTAVWTAGDVIRAAGYPLEDHSLATADGYIMHMERIPRPGSQDAVFFMHGILDTSMGWVSNGVTGSSAFAAYDQGFDVWLGNSRANPPRAHIHPAKSGARYWHYTVNELGMEDVAAQIDHIHITKCKELGAISKASQVAEWLRSAPSQGAPGEQFGSGCDLLRPPPRLRRAHSETALDALLAASPGQAANAGACRPPNEQHVRASNSAAQRQRRSLAGDGWGQPPAVPREVPCRPTARQPGLQQQAQRGRWPGLPGLAPQRRPDHAPGPPSEAAASGSNAAPPRHPPLGPQTDATSSFPVEDLTDSELSPSDPGDASEDATPRSAVAGIASSAFSQSTEPHSSPAGDDLDPASLDSSGSLSPARARARATLLQQGQRRVHMQGGAAPPALPGGVSDGGEEGVARLAPLPPQVAAMTPDRVAEGGVERAGSQQDIPAAGARPRTASDAATSTGGQQAGGSEGGEPYRLRAVGHSLGGASLLIYMVMCRQLGRPHHIARLILLTPAGFQANAPRAVRPLMVLLPAVMWGLARVRPGLGCACYIPSSLLRYITFKLTVDLAALPALNELTRAGMRVLLNGDKSQWDRALQMPHYNARSMPAVSFHTGMHCIQWCRTGRFQLYDYGSPAANMEHYGQPQAPDVAAQYWRIDVPVDIMAGRSDGIIAHENVIEHYERMRAAGCRVSLKEFELGHLDFTFGTKDELRHYVLSRLLAPC